MEEIMQQVHTGATIFADRMNTQYPITGNTINIERRKKRVKGITRFYSALNDFFQDLYRDEDENSEYSE